MRPSVRQRSREGRRGQGWQRGQRDDLTLQEAVHALWERRLLVAGCTLILFAVALAYGLAREPVYEAEARLSVRLEEGTGAAGDFNEILSGLQDSRSGGGLVVEEAAERAGWESSQRDFNERLAWEQVSDEDVVVHFSATTPDEAARAANAYAEVFVERLEGLKERLAGGTIAVNAEIEEAARAPEGGFAPSALIVAASAAACGLLLGGIGALVLESRAYRWSGSKDAELTLRAPVLAVIPDYSGDLLASRGDGAREGDAARDGSAR